MDARLLVESKFMVSETFGLGEVPKEPLVTIADVRLEVQDGDKGKERWGLLLFKEAWAKPLKVNRTHQRALMEMFGTETNAWINKRIGLYAMAGTFFGKRQTAVRIKGSPDIKAPISFQVKKFGGGKDTYDLVPLGAGAPLDPWAAMWNAWKGAGQSDKAGDAFKALVKQATGKPSAKGQTEADVAKFKAALDEKVNGAPPPQSEEMTDDEKNEAIRAEYAAAAERGANGGMPE